MYTRAYDEKLGIVIPESYNGTAFREDNGTTDRPDLSNDKRINEEQNKNQRGNSELHNDENEKSEAVGSFFSNLSFKGFFGNIFNNGNFGLQKIGTEEILIIATASFLLFSKDGDKECGIMLLLLLFLT